MSKTSLYNKLKAITDMGANDYINKFRLEQAITLIKTTDLTFTEISDQIGFTTLRYFSTAFKQYTGLTPTQYKMNAGVRINKIFSLNKVVLLIRVGPHLQS